jgi:hypothetical protein
VFRSEALILEDGRVNRIVLWRAGTRLSYAEVIQAWQHSQEFRDFYLSLLADLPFPAAFWESPPVTRETVQQAYEFVLIDSPQLGAAQADPRPFASSFARAAPDEHVLAFENLGGDALLIVPRPLGPQHMYAHLLSFVRGAPAAQRDALFQKLGTEMNGRLGETPIWASTSGLGVYWLHLRLDSYPKYYNFQPYMGVPVGDRSKAR